MNFFDSENNKLHSDFEQLKRQKSALSLKMNFVDAISQVGNIKDYSVSLEKCTCVDFMRRHKPCKHMYCLAMELGVFKVDEKIFSNLNNSRPAKTKVKKSFFNYEYSSYEEVPTNFVVIDFETANNNSDSICQVGIVVVENNLIVEEKSFLVCPPYKKFTNSHIHGITFDDVKNAPTFDVLWSNIKNYIAGHTIAAYNLFFDLGCLYATLERYQIEKPAFKAFDILAVVRNYGRFLLDLENCMLVSVADALGFQYKAHDALSDSEVTAKIQIYLSKQFPNMDVTLYKVKSTTIIDAINNGEMSTMQIVEYCKILFDERIINYDDYKNLFKLIEQIATQKNIAELFKCCGLFYEKFNKISRALFMYEKSQALDSKMKLKTRIQRLKKLLGE